MAIDNGHRNGAARNSAPTPGLSRPRRRGGIWQIPMFFAGVLSVALVGLRYTASPEFEARLLLHDLGKIRRAMTLQPPRTDKAIRVAELMLDRVDRLPEGRGEFHYLTGSAYLLRANPPDQDSLSRARRHLEEAERLGVPDADLPRLRYRLAKAWYHAHEAPNRVLQHLKAVVPDAADDLADAYGMLVQTYLSLPTPDYRAALDANERQLAQPRLPEELTAHVRLRQGELLLKLQRGEEGRKVLSRIPAAAPEPVRRAARELLVSSLQRDGLWHDAVHLWEAILADVRHPPADPGLILYQLGVCYLMEGRTPDALRVWQQALAAGGDGSQAAAFRLAELALEQAAGPAKAWDAFDEAFRRLSGEYHNALLPLAEVRRICEQGCQAYRAAADFDRSVRLAERYRPVAAPGDADRLIGQAADDWARQEEEKAARAPTEEARGQALSRCSARWLVAAKAYQAAGCLTAGLTCEPELVWKSADRYFRGQDYGTAESAVEQYLALDVSTAQLGEAWCLLGRVQTALRDQADAKHDEAESGRARAAARDAFQHCLIYPGPAVFRAHLQLALLHKHDNELDEAEAELQRNLELMRDEPDLEVCEQTRYALGSLLFSRHRYAQAAIRLEDALTQFPGSSAAFEARFQLAECFRALAGEDGKRLENGEKPQVPGLREHLQGQYALKLTKAAANYQKVIDDLTAIQATTRLRPGEEKLYRDATFTVAECKYRLKQYEEAVTLYQIAAARYHHQKDSMYALAQVVSCFKELHDPTRARAALEQMRSALPQTDDAALGCPRQDWDVWINKADQVLRDLGRVPEPSGQPAEPGAAESRSATAPSPSPIPAGSPPAPGVAPQPLFTPGSGEK